jgi:hypothetical protein
MGIPGFTAESALNRGRKPYSLTVALEPPIVGAAVIPAAPPQIDDYFLDWWVAQLLNCLPPLCGRDQYGRCHCLTVKSIYM